MEKYVDELTSVLLIYLEQIEDLLFDCEWDEDIWVITKRPNTDKTVELEKDRDALITELHKRGELV